MPNGYFDPGVPGVPGHFAGTRMCRVHSPRRGRRDAQGWGSCAFGAGCTCSEGSNIVGKRWAEPRSLCGPYGGGSLRLSYTQATSRDAVERDADISLAIETIWTNPRDPSSRGFLLSAEFQPADVQPAGPRAARQRSNAEIPSSVVIRSITPSCSILVPHLSSLAGLPRYLRAASS